MRSGLSGQPPVRRRLPWRRRLLFSTMTVGIGLGLLSLLDHVVGWSCAMVGRAIEPGWIFPPGHRSVIRSSEFVHVIATSRQGLRDRDYDLPAPAGTLRIAVVGDSFTYGWGVELEQIWPKRLEARLGAEFHGARLEVANLGQPGGDPFSSVAICQRVLPRLKPDWLIAAVTFGDDLVQLGLRTSDEVGVRELKLPRDLAAVGFPTTLALLERQAGLDENLIGDALRAQARAVLAHFDAPARARYQALEPSIRAAFEAGLINPVLVDHGCRRSGLGGATLNPDHPLMRTAARRLRLALERLDAICRAEGTRWMVVSVPYGGHVSPEVFAGRRRLGFELPRAVLETTVPDQIVAAACGELGVPFVTVTEAFRQDGAPGAYFPIDGHLSPAGHERFANLIAPEVQHHLAGLARRPTGTDRR